jgi:cytochrome c-type biogenesis protein CcmH
MCPICGTPLNLAAAPQAERERAFIRRLIALGQSKDEIKDALVREYGPEVLATPESEGFDLAAWAVPAAGIMLAGIALAIGVRRWRRRPAMPETAADEKGIDPEDSERLRSDLARYDL